MSLHEFIGNPNEKIFHSTGYAKVASGSSIGSTNTQSFRQRAGIDRNRQTVRRYGDSMIGQGHMKETARTQLNASNPLRQSEAPMSSSRQRFNARGSVGRPQLGGVPPRTFTEPPTRGYNPYG